MRRELTSLREDRAAAIESLARIGVSIEDGTATDAKSRATHARFERRARALDDQVVALEKRLGETPEPLMERSPEERAEAVSRQPASTATRARMLPSTTAGGRSHGDGLRGRALDVNERANTVPDSAREVMAKAIERDSDPDSKLARYVIATGDSDYASAFRKWLRDPVNGHREWTDDELRAFQHTQSEARAMSLGTTTAGGFLVSYELDPQVLISGTGSVNPLRQLARVEQVTQNENRFVTSAGVTASWDAEAAEVSDDTPTLAQPAITCHKGQAFVPVSFELFEDSPDLGNQIQNLFVDAKAQLESTAFTTGTGTAQPKGIITAISAVGGSVVTSAGSALTVDDIHANQNALPPRWRPNAQWMLNLSQINAARRLAAGSGLTTSIVDDSTTPPKMLGWTVNENSAMDGTIAAGTTNDYVLLSGDFKQFIIADRVGTTVEFVPHLVGVNHRPTGERGFLLHWRTGSDAVITDAFRLSNFSA